MNNSCFQGVGVNKRFEALDAFRGLCAISVVLFHTHVIDSITEINFFKQSHVFVFFFFVLSGFVLTHGYGYRDGVKFSEFMRSRFFRLYPLHLFMFAVFIVFEIGKLIGHKYAGINFKAEPFTASSAVDQIIPNLLLMHAWTSYTYSLSFNFPSWSISIEFYTYAIFFATVVLFKEHKHFSWLAVSLVASYFFYKGSNILKWEALTGLACFFGGAFAYAIHRSLGGVKLSFFSGSVIECILLVSIIMLVQSEPNHLYFFCSILFTCTVLVFSLESGVFSRMLKLKPFQYVGKLSYSIYMTHAAILIGIYSASVILNKLTGIEVSRLHNDLNYTDLGGVVANNIAVITLLCVVIVTSGFTFKYIECYGLELDRNKSPLLNSSGTTQFRG